MTSDVHEALLAFFQADDFDLGKEIVNQFEDVLLSDEGIAYLDRQVEHARDNPELLAVLDLKGRALRESRRMSIGFAFAQMFLELQPAVVSDEVAAYLAAGPSPEEVQGLLEEHPEYIPEIQRVAKGTVLQNELQAELMGSLYRPGDPRRVEACRLLVSLCDRRIDPETWASLAGELGNALSATAGSSAKLEEAIAIYRDLLTMPEVAASPRLLGSTEQNLGAAIAALPGQPERLREAAERLERSIGIHASQRDDVSVARASLTLAGVLLEWQGEDRAPRLDQAVEAALQAALLFERAGLDGEWTAAHETLEVAYATRWLESGRSSRQRICPNFANASWELAECNVIDGYRVEEWVPSGQSLELWSDLVTVERYSGAETMPFSGFVRTRRNRIADRVSNGRLLCEIVSESPTECVYEWSVTDDFGIEDQRAIVKLVRGEDALHALHFTRRAASDADAMAQWSAGLAGSLVCDEEPGSPRGTQPASRDDIDERLAKLAAPPQRTISDPASFCASMLAGVPRATMPDLHRSMLSLCGMHLYRDRFASYETLTAAVSVLRRSLEVPQQRDEMWARSASSLGRVWLRREQMSDQPNLQPALEAFDQAAEVFTRLEMPVELGAAYDGAARVAVRLADDPPSLAQAIGLFIDAISLRAREADPEGWAASTLALAEACIRLHVETGDEASLTQGEEAYERVLEALASDPLLAALAPEDSAGLLIGAIGGLNAIDREGIPEPRVPPGFADRQTEGVALYLRPLLTAGTLTLPNRFDDPSLFAVQFDVEPDELTLEAVLYRALGDRMNFSSIGGRTEGLGSTRWFVVGGEGWRDIALMQMEGADMVLMVPHDSPGVRWELEALREKSWLSKTVFLMPPESQTYDVEALWSGAADLMRAVGLQPPTWQPEGRFLRFGEQGSVLLTIPFNAVWRNELHDLLTEVASAS